MPQSHFLQVHQIGALVGFKFSPKVLKMDKKGGEFGADGSIRKLQVADGLLQPEFLGSSNFIEAFLQYQPNLGNGETSDHTGEGGFNGIDEPRFDCGVALIPAFSLFAVAGEMWKGSVKKPHFVTSKENGLDLVTPDRPVGFAGQFGRNDANWLKVNYGEVIGIAGCDDGRDRGLGHGRHGG